MHALPQGGLHKLASGGEMGGGNSKLQDLLILDMGSPQELPNVSLFVFWAWWLWGTQLRRKKFVALMKKKHVIKM